MVFAEWIDGQPLDAVSEAKKIDLMAAYQASIHSALPPPESRRRAAMPHIRWLFERLRPLARPLVDDGFLERLYYRLIERRPRHARSGVLHSDLITTNLVVTPGGVVSIDNEFLCVGYGQEWDILNTVKVSFPNRSTLQQRYLDTYARYRSLHTLVSHREYWEASYDVKMAGKRLSEGRVEEGLAYLKSAADRA